MKKLILAATTLVMALSACSDNKAPETVSTAEEKPQKAQKVVVYNWTEYIPADVLTAFTEETGIEVEYATYESNEAMFAKVKLLDGAGYDIVVPSTYFLEKMRKQDLLQPIDKSKLSNFANLDTDMLNKEYDPQNTYSVPYLWGSTSIAINADEVDADSITSWHDLWKPEFSGRLMIMDDLRDMFAMALKVAGKPLNTSSEADIKAGYEELKKLWPSIKVINSDSPKTPLIQGNVDLGVMWNGEAYMAQQEMGNVKFIYPQEGAVLWVDSFVIPKNAENVENAHKFIDFMLRAESGKAAIEELGYAAPNKASYALLDEELRNNTMIFPSSEDIAKGSFHQDLGEANLIYEKYWELLKAGK
ncbi:extracellular solute-binding protein [Catenovulum sp. 2E275]|uniref:extracellular solute-binding protein n=1 Tax=Catenovulum sp. 2E275 TaxID=2980497 RepID=UPI0021CED0D0|nr:extracellular solute-binding protein [Catenovulum sp. 2E275]MCU4677048.1 extracellular solute-binding protein [Catenovulum sp. 2E275]